MSTSFRPRAVRIARSASDHAYCTSTIRVISGPTRRRTPSASSTPAVHRRPDVELLPYLWRVQRILAYEHLPQRETHVVGGGRLQARARDPGIQIRLTDPRDALVGVDFDDKVVLRGAGRVFFDVRHQEHVALDRGDAHQADTLPSACNSLTDSTPP